MTSTPPASPSGPPDGMDGPALAPPLPDWSELADALYLAAYQDSALPAFDRPAAGQRGERPLQPGRSSHGQSGSEGQDDSRTPSAAGSGERRSDAVPAADGVPSGRPARLRLLGALGSEAETGQEQSGWPAAPRLDDTFALGRSLRPLRLTRDSPHEVELDEEATAERAAMAGVWTPVCRSLPERRLDLFLLVDTSPSMRLWSPTTRQIAELLEQTAAFRTVRTLRWNLDEDAPADVPAAVVHSSGHRLVLAVTDGGHNAWRTGHAASLLHRLGIFSPVAVLSLLPQQLWDLTLPTVTRSRLRARSAAVPNHAYEADRRRPEPLEPPQAGPGPDSVDAIAVPVVELRPTALGRWARLVAAADGGERTELAVLWAAPDRDPGSAPAVPSAGELADLVAEPPEADGEQGRGRWAAAVVRRFRATASPAAYALAQRLAAAPLNLPVMRLLQQAMPEAEFWNLSEIMLLGLVHRVDATADVEDAHRVSFDFAEGVREELLALGSRAETIRVLRQIQRHLGPGLEALWGEGGGALVALENDAAEPPVTEQTRPFVAHLYTALCAVSGPYLARANHLGRLLQRGGPAPAGHSSDGEPTTPGNTGTTASIHTQMRSTLNRLPQDALHSGQLEPRTTEVTNPRVLRGTSPTAPSSAVTPPARPAPRQGGVSVPSGSTLASSPRIWGNVPQRNRNFTGREALLERLRERLRGGVAAVLPEALHGMGGVGKSQIAIEYVYRHSREYRLVWWIPSEQETQIVQSLVELGEQMGLQAGSEMSAVPAVLEALRRGEPYSDWLLVFDNAEDPRTVRKYFPSDGPGSIVVTSRNSRWSTDFSSLEVDVFTREESVALLRRRSQNLPDDAVDHLAAALGDLPLAVEQAAVWLAETGMPVQQYLEVYERNFTELMQSDPPSDYNRSVAAAWNVSLERLRESRPDALQLLQVCAFFAPEPIDWDLFSAVRGVSVPPELQSTLDDPVRLGRAVREIGRYALARIDHRQNTVLMHRLVQRVLIEQMNPEEKEAMRHAAHQLLAHADPRNPQRSVYWPRYSSLLSHLRASDAVRCKDGWTRRLVLNEVRFLRARGDHEGSLALGEQAAAIWRADLSEDHEEILDVDQQIAETLREQETDLPRAFALQSDLVERFRRVLGEGHENTLRAQSYLAIHHRTRGNFEEAREMDKRVFETSAREFGRDDPATLLAAHNYAVSLRLAGNAEDALELDYDTWQRRIEVLGEDHINTLGTREAYLLDLQEVGRNEEANEGYETLAAEVTASLGEQHRFVALVHRNWCVALRKMGDYEAAYTLSSRYLELTAESLGTASRQYLLIAVSHANDLRQVGRLQEARILNQRVLEMHRAKYGREHPHSHAIAMNLAVTLRLLGESESALALDREAVEGLTRGHEQGHPRALLARVNLASDYFSLGRVEEAHALDAAVAEESTRLPENHSADLAVRLNLSYDLKALHRDQESEHLYFETLLRYRDRFGTQHPVTRDAEQGRRANADFDLLAL
ncbi:FxSxx-COOH system tetratricopeptide repeat protein [Streptomyces sp. NPDC059224]|uniref:FxSxx-COOH system tetratricopeptide repeat protein n=1 Tax=Streptomyces sp. NPDC059224 TaxID=3346775 RepID=UPI003674476D